MCEFLGFFIFFFSLVFYNLGVFLIKQYISIIPLRLVGYGTIIIANSVLCVSLAIYYPISNLRLWNNNCLIQLGEERNWEQLPTKIVVTMATAETQAA